MAVPRLLTIMGSGETSPTMVKTHRSLLARLDGPAVLLDTPFGFQANADDLAARAVAYFRDSVGAAMGVASYRDAGGADAVADERAFAAVREAAYVFAGPGSPSYALRQWAASPIPDLLRQKLRSGGGVTFASAAALTLGVVTVPVYEIYKVGEEPRWLPGLDLLAEAGLSAAVIPHFDNAEGGNHDTRYCYLGEPRLAVLERLLPKGAFVLGVDEHTGLVLDLDEGTATVVGRGVVTVRRDGATATVPAGETVATASLAGLAEGSGGSGRPVAAPIEAPAAEPSAGAAPGADQTPLVQAVARHQAAFDEALAGGDAEGASASALALEEELQGWAAEGLHSAELGQARSALRGMVVRLGEAAVAGLTDPAQTVGPFVDALLAARAAARSDRRFEAADALRDRLVELGVEVNDGPEGTTWRLVP